MRNSGAVMIHATTVHPFHAPEKPADPVARVVARHYQAHTGKVCLPDSGLAGTQCPDRQNFLDTRGERFIVR